MPFALAAGLVGRAPPQTLAQKGVALERDARIYDVCNPQRAKQVLDRDPVMSVALPCAVSVFREGERTRIAFLRPTTLLGLLSTADLGPAAEEVERTMTSILEAAVRA